MQSQRFVRTNVKRAMEIYIRVESRKGEEEDKKKEQNSDPVPALETSIA